MRSKINKYIKMKSRGGENRFVLKKKKKLLLLLLLLLKNFFSLIFDFRSLKRIKLKKDKWEENREKYQTIIFSDYSSTI
jgi:hypothetical protein